MATDFDFMKIALSKDDPLKAKMQEVVRLWIAGMAPRPRARMDEQILDQFPSDMPRDTALILLRDLVNENAMDTRLGIEIKNGHAKRATLVTNFTRDAMAWEDAVNAIVNDKSYRLCAYCKEPFSYKSTKAKFCSDLCRNYSSRENKKQVGE